MNDKEKMNSKASIVIPAYNAEQYINPCLSSVLSQTYENIEVIIIDDGSTDETASICLRFQNEDDRIIYIAQNNSGVSNARNRGIDVANGKYIVFIDADDMLSNSYIEQLVFAFENYPIQMASINHTNSLTQIENGIITSVDLVDANIVRSHLMDFTQTKYNGYVWEKMFLTDLVKQYVRFNKNVFVREDLLFIIQYLSHAEICGYTNRLLYYYRDNNESVLHNMTANRIKTQITMSRIVLENEPKTSKLYADAVEAYYESGRRYIEYLSKENSLTKADKDKWVKKQLRHLKEKRTIAQLKRVIACVIQKCCTE